MNAITEDFNQKFEIHYFLEKHSHSLDAQARLVCEQEFLAILKEVSHAFDVKFSVETEALAEGGLRNRWILKGKNVKQVSTVLTMIFTGVAAVSTAIQAFNSFPSDQEIELHQLQIENQKLQNKKLQAELTKMGLDDEQRKEVAQKVDELENNLKVRKRRSNLYSTANSVNKITDLGFSVLDQNNEPKNNEFVIPKELFNRFILNSDLLPDEIDETALIEIVSPVFKAGKTKWRGIYDGQLVTFEMKDSKFKKEVLLGQHTFQHGTLIEAVLVKEKEIDELGEEKVTNRIVQTVLRKVDGDKALETAQGKQYKHEKKLKSSQQELALNSDD